MKTWARFFSLLPLVLLTSCTTLTFDEMTAREVAERLDKIPVGTSYDKLIKQVPEITPEKAGDGLRRMRQLVYAYIVINPTHDGHSHMTMYRQFPRGVVLDLIPDDFIYSPKVSDNAFQSGEVAIFFDSTQKYRGYIAYSHGQYSIDKERLKEEREAFKSLRLGDVAELCENAYKRYLLTRDEELLPKLPLRANSAK